jgi:hypothetical protein
MFNKLLRGERCIMCFLQLVAVILIDPTHPTNYDKGVMRGLMGSGRESSRMTHGEKHAIVFYT